MLGNECRNNTTGNINIREIGYHFNACFFMQSLYCRDLSKSKTCKKLFLIKYFLFKFIDFDILSINCQPATLLIILKSIIAAVIILPFTFRCYCIGIANALLCNSSTENNIKSCVNDNVFVFYKT